jgi:hypothetical protein
VSSCPVYPVCCEKSHKDRVVIVPHDLISMIYRLVLTTHLEDEFGLELQLHLTPGLLDSEAATPLLHPRWIPIHEYGDSENQVIWLLELLFVRHGCCNTALVLSWLIPFWTKWKKVERRKLLVYYSNYEEITWKREIYRRLVWVSVWWETKS